MTEHLLYLQCDACLQDKPDGVNMRDFARLAVAITPAGALSISCVRHDKVVAFMNNHEVGDVLFEISAQQCGCDRHKKSKGMAH